MAASPPLHPDMAVNLGLSIILASHAPVILLDADLSILAASVSFCEAFQCDPASINDFKIYELGGGEWDHPQLLSLLRATARGALRIPAYEMDLVRPGRETRRLVAAARRLDYGDEQSVRMVFTVADVTDARVAEKFKDDLLREKDILLQEVQHRVANSLQIIASVLMHSARQVQSDETRVHLQDAHHRVMSVAALQRQLASSRLGEVSLESYFANLCESLGGSMIHDRNQLSLQVRCDPAVVSADVSVSLGLIVTELVINALKHAFPDHRPGAIVVSYRRNGPRWTLEVGDNGVGVLAHPHSRGGLGTNIIAALARQLDAEVDVAHGNPGTVVSIVHSQRPALELRVVS